MIIITGGASNILNPIISAEMLFDCIKENMDKALDINISLTTGVYKYDHVFKGNIYIYVYMFMYIYAKKYAVYI
jgi:hypothetical protein